MVLGEHFHRGVVSQIAERLKATNADAFLAFEPANVRYLSGLPLQPNDRPLAVCVWQNTRTALLVPQLESEYASGGWIRDIRWYSEHSADDPPYVWMAREAGGTVLVDSVPAAAWRQLSAEIDEIELRDLAGELRRIKSPHEIELIERAAEYADLALERTFARLTTGSTERDVLADVMSSIDQIMRHELGDLYDPVEPAIGGSIQSGTRASFPHAATSERRLSRGDSVIVEFRTNVAGYRAASGCTFFVGDPLRDVVRWVEASTQAQEVARSTIAPGVTAAAVDQAARKVIERAGLTNGLRHRTGHGIGLSVAEAPWLVTTNQTLLEPGMVLVNHPGVYVSGRTGARNSETILIEADGPRVLNPRLERWRDLEARLKEF